jgi:hypothetical protein
MELMIEEIHSEDLTWVHSRTTTTRDENLKIFEDVGFILCKWTRYMRPRKPSVRKTPGYQTHKQENQTLFQDPHSGSSFIPRSYPVHKYCVDLSQVGNPTKENRNHQRRKQHKFHQRRSQSSNRKNHDQRKREIPPRLCEHLNTCDASSFRKRKKKRTLIAALFRSPSRLRDVLALGVGVGDLNPLALVVVRLRNDLDLVSSVPDKME